MYSDRVDVVYSYRRSPFKYSQFVHRTGVAFIQVLGGQQGFLFLTNRLKAPGRTGTAPKGKEQMPSVSAEEIRRSMDQFCCDMESLRHFWEGEVRKLRMAPEEPPPLSI